MTPINWDLLHYLHNFVKYRKILLLYVHTYAFGLTWIYCIPTIRLWSAQCSNKNIVWYISKYHICLCTLYAVPKKFQNCTMRIIIITVQILYYDFGCFMQIRTIRGPPVVNRKLVFFIGNFWILPGWPALALESVFLSILERKVAKKGKLLRQPILFCF